LKDRGHPFDHTYIFVESRDDGRYKDRIHFISERKEDRVHDEYEYAIEQWREERENYIEIGTFRELCELDGDEYSFDFKKHWGGSYPTGLSAMCGDDSPVDVVRDKLEESSENSTEGDTDD